MKNLTRICLTDLQLERIQKGDTVRLTRKGHIFNIFSKNNAIVEIENDIQKKIEQLKAEAEKRKRAILGGATKRKYTKRYTCGECGRIFTSRNGKTLHIRIAHKKDLKSNLIGHNNKRKASVNGVLKPSIAGYTQV